MTTNSEVIDKAIWYPLTSENWINWFEDVVDNCKGAGKSVAITTALREYCEVPESKTAGTNGLEGAALGWETITTSQGRWVRNTDKYVEYEQWDAWIRTRMNKCISPIDRDAISDYADSYTRFKKLRERYTTLTRYQATKHTVNITSFKYDVAKSVEENWIKIRSDRRTLRQTSSEKDAFPDDQLWVYFTMHMPHDLKNQAEVLESMGKEHDVIIKRLQEIWDGSTKSKEKAFHATNSDSEGERYTYMAVRRKGGGKLTSFKCYNCGSEEHVARKCPFKEKGMIYMTKLREAAESRSSRHAISRDHDMDNDESDDEHLDRSRKTDRRRRSRKSDSGRISENKSENKESRTRRTKAYTATSDMNSTSDSSDSDDSLIMESANISNEDRSKANSTDWICDTGCTTPMTDQLSLFECTKPCRRGIKVGGGVLYSTHKGTAKAEIGSRHILLTDCLLVPQLGANLLSARKLASNGKDSLLGLFNGTKMWFMKDSVHYFEATLKNGLYVLSKIHNTAHEGAFSASHKKVRFALAANGNNNESCNERKEQRIIDRYTYYHRRFAHAGPKHIATLHNVTDIDRVLIPSKLPKCEVCAKTKMRKISSTKLAEHKQEKLALISLDVAGPFPASYRGFRYFAEIIDNFTRKSWVLLLKNRSDLLGKLNHWAKSVELESGCKIKATRTDNAPEILETLEGWKASDGVRVETTEPYVSRQNGPAERAIQYTENNSRSMLEDAKLPVEFWCEAAEAQSYIKNRMKRGPIKDADEGGAAGEGRAVIQQSPEQAWTGSKPHCNNIYVWGCKAIMHVARDSLPGRQDKLMPTGGEGIFVGYDAATTRHHRIYRPDLHRTVISSSVRFFEDTPGSQIADYKLWIELSDGTLVESPGTPNELPERRRRGRPLKAAPVGAVIPAQETHVPQTETIKQSAPGEEAETTKQCAPGEEAETKNKQGAPGEEANSFEKPIFGSSLLPSNDQSIEIPDSRTTTLPAETTIVTPIRSMQTRGMKRKTEDEEEEANKRHRAMMAILDWFEEHEGDEAALAAVKLGIVIPDTYEQAISGKYANQWKEAIEKEIEALRANHTWREEFPPNKANLISTKWVFSLKTNSDGTLERFKARLVARGFSQQYGIDFNETFAPTVRMATLRTFLAIVALEDLHCHHFDIKNAFTESHLQESLYISAPKGVPVKRGMALRLLRSLYGLKQSARDWNLLMDTELKNWGFVQSKADPCLYVHPVQELVLLVYVDDIAIAGRKIEGISWFEKTLKRRFDAKSLGEIRKILGVRIIRKRDARVLTIDQEEYVNTTLTKFGYEKAKHKDISTPVDSYVNLRPALPEDTRTDPTKYREIIGSLMYAMIYTRPDIAFVLGKLSQYMQDPAEHHRAGLNRVMRYLRSTVQHRICFRPAQESRLQVYSDADYAADKTDRKSISGSLGLLGGGPIFYASKKQKAVSTATTEAEYVSMAVTAKQGQWIAQILRDMGYPEYVAPNGMTVATYGDNQGAIALAKNPHLTERSKHIDVAYHYVRDLQKKGRTDIQYIPTDKMAADGLTKPLAKAGLKKFKEQIGMWFAPRKDLGREDD